ncbi:hypothetical protein V1514DRAFT_47608 [Lipomyces japonicus]|uniref:uncharacterized protein n=1 Tax=Lipomyces japonicus TaxID=56871 RepID=UPI0034CD4A10
MPPKAAVRNKEQPLNSGSKYKRVIAPKDNFRQEEETEEVFDVVSVSSDTASAISISDTSSSRSGSKKNKQQMSKKRKSRNDGGGGTSSSIRRSAKAKVPYEYLEMVNEVTNPSSQPELPRKKRSLSSIAGAAKSNVHLGNESVIDLGSDTSSAPSRQYTPATEVLKLSEEPNGPDLVAMFENDEDFGAGSEESDWENIEIGGMNGPSQVDLNDLEAEEQPQSVEFTLGETTQRKQTQKKKSTITKGDRETRWSIHSVHLLSLLYFGSMRSKWCNDHVLKSELAKFVSSEVGTELHPDKSLSVPQRTRKFLDGLRHVMNFWNKKFRIIYRGMQKRRWEEIDDMKKQKNAEPSLDFVGFRKSLGRLEGSRDLGAQGFCALLRAFRLRARLIFSIQPLSFTFNSKSTKPSRLSNAIIEQEEDNDEAGPSTPPKVRLRRPQFNPVKLAYTMTDYDAAKIEEAPYPIFWVEVWDEASLQWISIDPMVQKLIEVPKSKSKFEPPASETANMMSYVIAYDAAGHAKDVTRRYAQFYNAKNRKTRITNEPIGQIWFDRVMRIFQSPYYSEIDQMEDAALSRKEASEDLPNNIQDYKGHPIFVLERHLRQNEIIHPLVPCGRVAIGRNKSETEPIFRRRDVKTLRSATQWYKIGRQIKIGEQPMKHGKKRSVIKSSRLASDNEDEDNDDEVGLYADFQTELYVPPAVVNSKVPKNDYGNLDVFVPSMVPLGAVHIRLRGAANAAKLLGIDYADAVCGFDFASRRATPRVEGIVVAEEYNNAVMAVFKAQMEQQQFEEDERKKAEALIRWRRYLTVLRVRERVAQNPAFRHSEKQEVQELESLNGEHDEGGGFVNEQVSSLLHEQEPGGF